MLVYLARLSIIDITLLVIDGRNRLIKAPDRLHLMTLPNDEYDSLDRFGAVVLCAFNPRKSFCR